MDGLAGSVERSATAGLDPVRAEAPPTRFWRPEAVEYFEDSADAQLVLPSPDEWAIPKSSSSQGVPAEPITPLIGRLLSALASLVRSHRVDVPQTVRRLSRGDSLRELPRRLRQSWPGRVLVWVDRSPRLTSFRREQIKVLSTLRRLCGEPSVQVWLLPDGPSGEVFDEHRASVLSGLSPSLGDQVLILSDLGRCGHEADRRSWAQAIAKAHWSGLEPVVITPGMLEPSARALVVPWPRESGVSRVQAQRAARRLRGLMSLFCRCEPGLFRQLRRLDPDASLMTEVEVWAGPDVRWEHRAAVWLSYEAVAEARQDVVEWLSGSESEQAREVVAQAYALVKRWHTELAPEVYHLEVLTFASLPSGSEIVGEADRRAAIQYFRALIGTTGGSGRKAPEGLVELARRIEVRDVTLLRDVSLGLDGASNPLLQLVARTTRDDQAVLLPEGVLPEAWARARSSSGGQVLEWRLLQDECGLTFGSPRPKQTRAAASPIVTLEAREPSVVVQRDGESPQPPASMTLQSGLQVEVLPSDVWAEPVPSWADRAGRDRFGRWADVEVEGVRFRMRYIEPGTFMMGSPEDEAGRLDSETQHEVTLSEGYWMADAPCTQALWSAVMGDNPAENKGPLRPVETVSWDDAQRFFSRLEALRPGLGLGLPTEAQWEYACRAGSTEATYAGGLSLSDDGATVPELDDVAWYYGNLDGETHPVREKRPNDWGLYDTLGNVWEWCQDWFGGYEAAPSVDPTGARRGTSRVLRGGSWFNLARHCRAAYRDHFGPSIRRDSVGLRVSRGPAPSPASEPEARPGPRAEPRAEASQSGRSPPVRSGLVLITDRMRTEIGVFECPEWAVDVGRDRFGLWADVEVEPKKRSVLPVVFRMRWIPPGRFMMGSPETEAGRFDNETPHPVTISRGYWLGDTPMTQAVWSAVRGDNPSEFKTPDRPVEMVSWEDVQAFLPEIDQRVPGFSARLPSEAEWEYACRAGTKTATYLGEPAIIAEFNAPLLDVIAWYGGNSGLDFDLDNGQPPPEPNARQYDFHSAGTRRVKGKQPNPWGLFDCLGNVWEWCLERFGDESRTPAAHPDAAREDRGRILRGGCWFGRATSCQASSRNRHDPTHRHDSIGFRLSGGASTEPCFSLPELGAHLEGRKAANQSENVGRSGQTPGTGPEHVGGGEYHE